MGLLFLPAVTAAQPPVAQNGRMDLSAWDFAADGAVALDGQWAFYAGRLLSPTDFNNDTFSQPKQTMRVPGLWEAPFHTNRPYAAKGVATYRLRVVMAPDGRPKALRISNCLSVAQVWIDGSLAAQSGTIGRDLQSEHPREHTLLAAFTPAGPLTEIVIQVSNFNNVRGGINASIWLGNRKPIELSTFRKLAVTAVLGGVLIFMGIYHLLLFAVQRSEIANLYFGLYVLSVAASKLFHDAGASLLATLFPQMPWHWSINGALLPYGLSIPLIVMFYHAVFPRNRIRALETAYQVLGGIFIVYILATGPNAFDDACILYRFVALALVPYLAWRLAIDLLRREKEIHILLPGYLLLAAAGVNDLIYDVGLFKDSLMIPYGLFAFICCYSILISMRFSRAFSQIQQLSRDERTARINYELSRKEAYLTNLEINRLALEVEQRRHREAEARLAAEKARLEKLRYQMNPHFLYNTLTNIRGAILRDPGSARKMVSDMAAYFRISLDRGNQDFIPVEEELDLLALYLGIEGMRLGDYLSFHVDVAEAALKKQSIPAFMLQPLVENAIKYGAMTSPQRLEIRIGISRAKRLRVAVANSGRWVDRGARANHSTGIGLDNIRQRLEKLYAGKASLERRCANGKVEVTLLIPLPGGKAGTVPVKEKERP